MSVNIISNSSSQQQWPIYFNFFFSRSNCTVLFCKNWTLVCQMFSTKSTIHFSIVNRRVKAICHNFKRENVVKMRIFSFSLPLTLLRHNTPTSLFRTLSANVPTKRQNLSIHAKLICLFCYDVSKLFVVAFFSIYFWSQHYSWGFFCMYL